MLELQNMIIVVGFVFYEGNKYYPQVFLDVCKKKFSYNNVEISWDKSSKRRL